MVSWKRSRNETDSFRQLNGRNEILQSNNDWRIMIKEFIFEFLYSCKFGLYVAFITIIYTNFIRDALPGRWSEIFLAIAFFQGKIGDMGNNFLKTFIPKLLENVKESYSLSDKNDE